VVPRHLQPNHDAKHQQLGGGAGGAGGAGRRLAGGPR
jgi:hypothetical protein